MMINSIASYKASLSRIAHEVLDAADELEIPRSTYESPSSAPDRRISRRPPIIAPTVGSPIANGTDHPSQDNEEQLNKLHEENGSLRKSLDAKEGVAHVAKDESPKSISNKSNVIKGNMDNRSPIRLQRNTSQGKSRSASHLLKNSTSEQDGFSNGTLHATPFDAVEQKMESEFANSLGNGKEHKKLPGEIRSLESIQTRHELEIKQLRALLDNEREIAATVKLKLQEECTINEASQKELQDLKIEKEKTFGEMKMLQMELNEKMSELRRLQAELSRRGAEEEPNMPPNNLNNMQHAISEFEKENLELKRTIKDMTVSMRRLEESLKDACKERDKALQELARLKQHLLDKELEDSDKMDEDNKIIEELRVTTERQTLHILQLEKALHQELAKKEEIKNLKSDELQKSQETIKGLTQKVTNLMTIVDSKNIELQNLQTALGQYYAESEAKERLGRDFAVAREQIAKLSESLKAANQALEISSREKEDIISKYSQIERMLLEGKHTVQKLEEDNSKLRRALEKSMTTLNRMSLDSDNYVDRRIVIKLLVTYFQRNHSKEVLDLIVRMLGFAEEDKKRIGFAQSAVGKGVVRGVLGLPGRLVGGILGGGSPETSHASDNQSFADLWVDFLLTETEKRESEEAARMASSVQASTPIPSHGTSSASNSSFPTPQYSSQPPTTLPSRAYQPSEHLDAEFATVPLTSSVLPHAGKGYTRFPPRY